MKNKFKAALIILSMFVITCVAYSSIRVSGTSWTSSVKVRYSGMNYIVFENCNGGVAIINLTKDAAETDHYKTMTAILKSQK